MVVKSGSRKNEAGSGKVSFQSQGLPGPEENGWKWRKRDGNRAKDGQRWNPRPAVRIVFVRKTELREERARREGGGGGGK